MKLEQWARDCVAANTRLYAEARGQPVVVVFSWHEGMVRAACAMLYPEEPDALERVRAIALGPTPAPKTTDVAALRQQYGTATPRSPPPSDPGLRRLWRAGLIP